MAVETRRLAAGAPRALPRTAVRGENSRLRVVALGLVVALIAGTIWTRLAYWQVVEHGRLSQWAARQYEHVVPLPPARGVILDRQGQPLAVNTTVYSVFVSPDNVPVRARETVATGLAASVGADHDAVLKTLESGKKFAYIARRQPKAKADAVRQLQLPGVGLEPEQQRSYLPGGAGGGTTLAANLLGFVNFDGQGQYGVEGYYDKRLAGRPGFKTTYRDAAGRDIALGPSERVNPVNGADLVLTLDAGIQYAAEQAIAEGVKANKAESGSVIVLDTKTGGIVAEASYPTYNANSFTSQAPDLIKDRAVSDLYEPGSIMKVPTLAGALQNHAITPTTTINDPGYINVGGTTLHDWDLKNHGTVTYTRVLEESYNVGAVRAEQAEGLPAFYNNLVNFGFNAPSGVDLAAEASATPLQPLDQWRDSELATASYGQGIATNMMQMAAAVNVIANGGRYAQPHVVDRAGGQQGPLATASQRQVLDPATDAQMRDMMMSVVQHGSGYTARVPGFELDEAGKTGTSQMPEAGGYSFDHVWASYAGFLPADNPRFTMLVVVRKPNNGSFDHNEGYYVSAPIWKRIAESIVLQWHITPGPPKKV